MYVLLFEGLIAVILHLHFYNTDENQEKSKKKANRPSPHTPPLKKSFMSRHKKENTASTFLPSSSSKKDKSITRENKNKKLIKKKLAGVMFSILSNIRYKKKKTHTHKTRKNKAEANTYHKFHRIFFFIVLDAFVSFIPRRYTSMKNKKRDRRKHKKK